MDNSNRDLIKYLITYHESIQKRVNQIDERGAGPINLATIVAATVAAVGLFVANEDISGKICILIPACVIAVISIHCYNNRLSAILGGCLAGSEDVLAELIGKNVFINHRGYTNFNHMPFFITNDWMGIMYLALGFSGTGYAFWKIFKSKLLPFPVWIGYLIFFIAFCLLYGFELWTNDQVKFIARTYYHMAYDQIKDSDGKPIDFRDFDANFNKLFQGVFFLRIFSKSFCNYIEEKREST